MSTTDTPPIGESLSWNAPRETDKQLIARLLRERDMLGSRVAIAEQNVEDYKSHIRSALAAHLDATPSDAKQHKIEREKLLTELAQARAELAALKAEPQPVPLDRPDKIN